MNGQVAVFVECRIDVVIDGISFRNQRGSLVADGMFYLVRERLAGIQSGADLS